MGYLDELKRQAEAAKAAQTTNTGAVERNALVVDGACMSAFRYFSTLSQQLNVLQPSSKAVYRFDARTVFNNLRLTGFRADSRQKKLRDAEVFDHVVLSFDLKTGTRIEIAKDFPPEIDKLEARLDQCGAVYESEIIRDPATKKFLERRYRFKADFRGSVRLLPEHDTGWIRFQVVNLDGFETVNVRFPAIEVGSGRLDELARWIVGEPNGFLKDGHDIRRVVF